MTPTKLNEYAADALTVVAICAIVVGLGMLSIPAALVVFGIILISIVRLGFNG